MENETHTPGPWGLETVETSCGICHKIGPFPWKDGKANYACIYADYPGNGPIEAELRANARLITAAPDLLKAVALLHFLLPSLFDALDLDHTSDLKISHPKEGVIFETTAGGLLETLAAAFEKATGKEQA